MLDHKNLLFNLQFLLCGQLTRKKPCYNQPQVKKEGLKPRSCNLLPVVDELKKALKPHSRQHPACLLQLEQQ
jgi:hypothetical protein